VGEAASHRRRRVDAAILALLLEAGDEVLPLVCEVGEEEAHQREAAVAPLDLALRDQDHLAVVGDEDLR